MQKDNINYKMASSSLDEFDFGAKKKKITIPTENTEPSTTVLASLETVKTDYTYDELLDRIYSQITEKEAVIHIKTPIVCREGTKKTAWVNFQEVCKCMSREGDHVQQYMLAELGAKGAIDGAGRFIIAGRFQPIQIENLVKRYIAEYVKCSACRCLHTTLSKENRLFFLTCQECNSRKVVSAITQGFKAQVTKRSKDRELATQ